MCCVKNLTFLSIRTGVFLIPYFTAMALVGIPLYYLELVLGQFSGLQITRLYSFCPLIKGKIFKISQWPRYDTCVNPFAPIQAYTALRNCALLPQVNPWDREGCYLAMRCSPLYWLIVIYFEGVSLSVTTAGRGGVDHEIAAVVVVGTPAGGHCLGDFGDGQFYLSHIGGCSPDRVIWLATLPVLFRGLRRDGTDCTGGSRSRACYRTTGGESACSCQDYLENALFYTIAYVC
jgi:hypothetical protein